MNVTPLEPGWEGHVTLEFSNTTPLPGEGLRQRRRVPVPVPSGQRALRGQLRRPRRQIYGPEGRDAAEAVSRHCEERATGNPAGLLRSLAMTDDDFDEADNSTPPIRSPSRASGSGCRTASSISTAIRSARCRGARRRRLRETAERQWGDDLIASWNKHGWIDWPTRIAAKLAPIVGAKPSELLIADSTSVCLFKLLAAAVQARPGRKTILTQQRNFPTDLYVAQGLADMLGLDAESGRAATRSSARSTTDTAVVTLTHVDYRSAAFYDMRAINEAAHAAGRSSSGTCRTAPARSSSTSMARGCDLAVGCGYKYLNGGPGAPAFLYVAERSAGRAAIAAAGLDGPCRALRLRRRLSARRRHPELPDRHAVDPRARRARSRARHLRRHRDARPRSQVARAVAAVHRRGRSALRRRSAPRLARATRRSAAATSSSRIPRAMRSCRR